MAMAAELVPGVITVTPHARYYSLHGLVADEVTRRELRVEQAQSLVRRCEVVLAVASWIHHSGRSTVLGKAHGTDNLVRRLTAGIVDLGEASLPVAPGYVGNPWGFLAAYRGPATTLGVLAPGAVPTPGPRLDVDAVRGALCDVLELAAGGVLEAARLGDVTHLCLCRMAESADGAWLSEVLCRPDTDEQSARDRRHTIQLIARVIQTHDVDQAARDLRLALAFGDFLTLDEVAGRIPIGAAWQGVLLRNYSVGAWRRLWARLVNQVTGAVLASAVADEFADQLPAGTVGRFVEELPATTTASGAPAPAEEALRDYHGDDELPWRELGVLAVGARRASELTGHTREAFVGRPGTEFGPVWMTHRLASSTGESMRDFGRQLVVDMIDRARRIGLGKTRRRPDGTLSMPARLRELEGGWLFRTSNEGAGDVSLRLDQLCSVLAGAGVLDASGERWAVTARGQHLLST